VEVGAGQHLYPEAAGTALEKDKLFSRDQTILVVWLNRPLPGHDSILPRMFAVPELDGSRPFLMLPFPAGTRVEIESVRRLENEWQPAASVEKGAWAVQLWLRLVVKEGTQELDELDLPVQLLTNIPDPEEITNVGTVSPGFLEAVRGVTAVDSRHEICRLGFFLSRGLYCYAFPPEADPPPVVPGAHALDPLRFRIRNEDVLRGFCFASVGDEEAEFLFAPDTGAVGSPSFDAAYTEVYGPEGRRFYRHDETGRIYRGPTQEEFREAQTGGTFARGDCVTEETPAQLWIRVLMDVTPAAPFFLAYEAASGRSWTSGMRLSDGERALAGAGLFLSAFAHAGGISKLSAFKSRRAAMKFVDEIIDFSKLPKSFGRRQMMHELLVRGAARLTKRQAQRIEEAVEVLRKNAGKNQAQRAGAVRKALGTQGMKELDTALNLLTQPAKAKLILVDSLAHGALGGRLSKTEAEFVAEFMSLGKVTEDMLKSAPKLKNVSVVGSGLVVTSGIPIPKEQERIARAMAELGALVVSPGRGTTRTVVRQLERALGLVQLPGTGKHADLLGAALKRVVAVEAYTPTARTLGTLGRKLRAPQGPYIIVDIGNLKGFGLAEATKTIKQIVATDSPSSLLRGIGVLSGGTIHMVWKASEGFGPFAAVVLATAPAARHALVPERDRGDSSR